MLWSTVVWVLRSGEQIVYHSVLGCSSYLWLRLCLKRRPASRHWGPLYPPLTMTCQLEAPTATFKLWNVGRVYRRSVASYLVRSGNTNALTGSKLANGMAAGLEQTLWHANRFPHIMHIDVVIVVVSTDEHQIWFS